jgi:pyruvate dehydrogenase E1 component
LDQALANLPTEPEALEARRRGALMGGYRLRSAGTAPQVTLIGAGAVMGEILEAAAELERSNIPVDVICLTSADLIFRAWRARQGLAPGSDTVIDALFPPGRRAPIVAVLDGHPHTLSFLGAASGSPVSSLGVDDFGQSGDVQDLYRHFEIDAETIIGAALDHIT